MFKIGLVSPWYILLNYEYFLWKTLYSVFTINPSEDFLRLLTFFLKLNVNAGSKICLNTNVIWLQFLMNTHFSPDKQKLFGEKNCRHYNSIFIGSFFQFYSKKFTFKDKLAKKLKISRYGVPYSLQTQLETGVNVDKKRSSASQVTTVPENKHLIIQRIRNWRKTDPELTANLNSPWLRSV